MNTLLRKIRNCTECEGHLDAGVNPVLAASQNSRLAIVSQAPGRRVHETSIPWNDKSGDTLRNWLEVDKAEFYDQEKIALIPMGFCYPGKGKSGDLPPRRECAPLWHPQLFGQMKKIKLVLLVGQYAQKYYLPGTNNYNLTDAVRHFQDYLPHYFPLPHPSPRNFIWQRNNKWFEEEVLPELRRLVRQAIS